MITFAPKELARLQVAILLLVLAGPARFVIARCQLAMVIIAHFSAPWGLIVFLQVACAHLIIAREQRAAAERK